MSRAFIGLGSNIAPEENVRAALRRLGRAVHIVALSTFYRTRAEGRPEEPDFYNGVVAVDTDLTPHELKHLLRGIEKQLGRRRTEDRFASRTIDLDLLLYDDLCLEEEDLRLPDPDIVRRPFLALPLRELAPGFPLPGSSLTLREVADALVPGDMKPLPEYTRLLRTCLRSAPKGTSRPGWALPKPGRHSRLSTFYFRERVWRSSKHALKRDRS